jgi:DNA-binding NarL/FixJ family response regulator
MTIRVLLCDNHPVWRAGLRAVLEGAGDIEVVADLSDGSDAVQQAALLRPDVVLVDIDLPGLDGLAVTRQLAGPNVADAMRVIVVAGSDRGDVVEWVRAGARGYLLKDLPAVALVSAVRAVATGEAMLAPVAVKQVIEHFAECSHDDPGKSAMPAELENLTCRELGVLRLIARGLTNADIANALSLSIATVKSHVSHILGKLKLRDRAQAVVMAYETGFVQPGRIRVDAATPRAGC